MHAFVQTERLALRHFTADDADLLVELDSDPAVLRYLTGGEATAPEVVSEQILLGLLRGYARWDGEFGVFPAYELDGRVASCTRSRVSSGGGQLRLRAEGSSGAGTVRREG